MRQLARTALVAVSLLLAQAGAAWACSVCYGAADSPVIRGAELSILFMIGVTYSMVGGGLVGFLLLRRHRRKQLEQSR